MTKSANRFGAVEEHACACAVEDFSRLGHESASVGPASANEGLAGDAENELDG